MKWSRTLQLSPQKFGKLTATYGQILSYARQGPDLENSFFNFVCVEFYCGHFKSIPSLFGHFKSMNNSQK
jgi:hypothetical protein